MTPHEAIGQFLYSPHRMSGSDLLKYIVNSDHETINQQIPPYGRTPLMRLCYYGHYDEAKVLLDCSADPNIQDNSGLTALALAALRDRQELTKLLVCSGANPGLVDKNGKTALDVASGPCRKIILHTAT